MPTVRSRAIELAADPINFSDDSPVPPLFENPGDAKLEADAHLAVCISSLADELAGDEDRHERFLTHFRDSLDTLTSHVPSRKPINGLLLGAVFKKCLGEIYVDSQLTEALLGSGFGMRTTRACGRYATLADAYAAQHSSQMLMGNNARAVLQAKKYHQPGVLIQAGISGPLGSVMGHTIEAIHANGSSPEVTEQHLGAISAHGKFASALSQDQLDKSVFSAAAQLEITDRKIDPGIIKARQKPINQTDFSAALRPHHGCPAMPSFPEDMDHLVAGSGVEKLLDRAAELMVALNLHVPQGSRELYLA